MNLRKFPRVDIILFGGCLTVLLATFVLSGFIAFGLAMAAWTAAAVHFGYRLADGQARSSIGPPVPPVNVRAVMASGVVIPLEMSYAGVQTSAHHIWSNVTTLPEPPAQTRVDELPAHTAIAIVTAEAGS